MTVCSSVGYMECIVERVALEEAPACRARDPTFSSKGHERLAFFARSENDPVSQLSLGLLSATEVPPNLQSTTTLHQGSRMHESSIILHVESSIVVMLRLHKIILQCAENLLHCLSPHSMATFASGGWSSGSSGLRTFENLQ
ncbi:hypothetical protein Tco_1029326 [Tanacetum coccineum]|uniref:Uncharacterized protein n=1 Tax=Tanacetum coccineum TaxID=301880 RepID=A0ABQ5G334_9ASTR